MKAFCPRIIEGIGKGGGFILRRSCCAMAKHLAPHKSVLDSNTSVVHIWINASAQPTTCQLQPDELTDLPSRGRDTLSINSLYVSVDGGVNEYRVAEWRGAHTQSLTVLKLLCLISWCYTFRQLGTFQTLAAHTMASENWWTTRGMKTVTTSTYNLKLKQKSVWCCSGWIKMGGTSCTT